MCRLSLGTQNGLPRVARRLTPDTCRYVGMSHKSTDLRGAFPEVLCSSQGEPWSGLLHSLQPVVSGIVRLTWEPEQGAVMVSGNLKRTTVGLGCWRGGCRLKGNKSLGGLKPRSPGSSQIFPPVKVTKIMRKQKNPRVIGRVKATWLPPSFLLPVPGPVMPAEFSHIRVLHRPGLREEGKEEAGTVRWLSVTIQGSDTVPFHSCGSHTAVRINQSQMGKKDVHYK